MFKHPNMNNLKYASSFPIKILQVLKKASHKLFFQNLKKKVGGQKIKIAKVMRELIKKFPVASFTENGFSGYKIQILTSFLSILGFKQIVCRKTSI